MANKKTSRLAKQGKLKLADKKRKRKKLAHDLKQQKQEASQHTYMNGKTGDEEDDPTKDETDSSDENTEFFNHLRNAKEFARLDLSNE